MKEKKKISAVREELARAFAYTIINPILDGLSLEVSLLSANQLNWNFATGWFKYFGPIIYYTDSRYEPNYELFVRKYTKAARLISIHDKHCDQLAKACTASFNELIGSNKFGELLRSQRVSNFISQQKLFEAELRLVQVIASHIVNNHRKLSKDYETSEVWNELLEEFLSLRNESSLKPLFDKTELLKNGLLDSAKQIQDSLVSIREKYANAFGIPPIPLQVVSDPKIDYKY